ncbi:MAG: hypothetical protein ACI8W8_002719 [Rhodothermales bacterium]|jgi:hypothetical protein
MKTTLAILLAILGPSALSAFDHNHAAWDADLKRYVNSKGLVDYRTWKRDSSALNAYLKTLASAKMQGWTRDQQLAFWVNAYNAITIRYILDAYPVASIRDIDGVWKSKRATVAGRSLTLDSIEHVILRKELREPRIHFAIVCASIGCPNLIPEAFRAEGLSKQLDAAATAFVRNPQKLRIDAAEEEIHLSRIFKWFGEDFEGFTGVSGYWGKTNGILSFVATYLSRGGQRYVRNEELDVEWLDYDWSLNTQ